MLCRSIEATFCQPVGQIDNQESQRHDEDIQSNSNSNRKEKSSKKSNVVEFRKKMPRYIGHKFSLKPTLIFPQEKVKCLFMEHILDKNNISDSRDRKQLLQVNIEEYDTHAVIVNTYAVIFNAVDRKDLVKQVENNAQSHIKGIGIAYNMVYLLKDHKSIILMLACKLLKH